MLLKFFIEKFPLVFKKTDTKFSVSVFEFLIIIYFVLFIIINNLIRIKSCMILF